MCGIIGVVGSSDTLETLLEGLQRLEYRGYDSAGVALVRQGQTWRARTAGRNRIGECAAPRVS